MAERDGNYLFAPSSAAPANGRMPYFDHNATTPLAPVAREAWLQIADDAWQNPSSLYRDAARAKIRLDQARERLGEYLGADPGRVVFNSGATEGANTVLAHWARTSVEGDVILLNPTEHSCVLGAAGLYWENRYEMLPVDSAGRVEIDSLRERVAKGDVRGVAVMAANNETGVLQPWAEIAAVCSEHRVEYLCDAAQWLGKITASGLAACSWLLATGHKFGAPKGTGWLLTPEKVDNYRPFGGGYQENGYRAGTEDLAGIHALVAAFGQAEHRKVLLEPQMEPMKNDFERHLQAAVPGVRLVGSGAERLWNTTLAIMPRGENHRWVLKLDKRGFQVSTGSACSSQRSAASTVLTAIGFTAEEAKRALRFSSGWDTRAEDWVALAHALAEVNRELSDLEQGIIGA